MKIAIYVPSWPPGSSPNGIVTYAANLIPALRKLGHEVFVVSPNVEGDDPYTFDLQKFAVHPSIWTRAMFRIAPEGTVFSAATVPLVSAIRHLVEKHGVEIFEMEETFGWCHAVSKLELIPVIIRLHGPWFLTKSLDDQVREKREGCAIRSAQAVTSPSLKILELVNSRYNLKQQGLCVANSIEPTSVKWSLAACDRSSIVFIGRFDELKGGDVVINTFGKLASTNPDLKLTFVGPDGGIDDEKLGAYARRVLSADALSRLTYVGPLPHSEIAALRTKHFLTLCASRFEVFSYTVLEAMSIGCPIVASAVGGIPELIQPGYNGLLFDPENLDEIVAAIQKLFDNPSLAEQMGERARQRSLALFSTERAAARSAEIYRQEIEKFSLHQARSRTRED